MRFERRDWVTGLGFLWGLGAGAVGGAIGGFWIGGFTPWAVVGWWGMMVAYEYPIQHAVNLPCREGGHSC